MKSKVIIVVGLFAVLVAGMAGCGGGGGSSTGPVTPTTATLKLSINGLPAGVKVGALQVYFKLPAGVAPTPLTGNNDASGSIAFSGNAIGVESSLSLASYVFPTVKIVAESSGGLLAGEYLTMNCTIDPTAAVSVASFPAQATIDKAIDTGNPLLPITGLTVPIAVTLQ